MAGLYLGLSGFSYREWKGEGLFYPPEMKASEYFQYYVGRFNSLEADGTFYRIPSQDTLDKWIKETPDGFRVSPKMSQKITHFARLKPTGFDALRALVTKLESVEKAGKLGTTLIQLHPQIRHNEELLIHFLEHLPNRPTIPWTIEFHHKSWNKPEVQSILRERSIAWCTVDRDDEETHPIDLAQHLYIRLRRTEYSDASLQEWAGFVRSKIAEGKDCYVYCKHEDAERPWEWADRLWELVHA